MFVKQFPNKYGTVLINLTVDIDKFVPELARLKKEKAKRMEETNGCSNPRYIDIIFAERREPDPYGNTHDIYENTYSPTPKNKKDGNEAE
jgi:hypothetical protein